MSPIFMIGTQRSGSNLLRLMLNQLNEIVSPHPPHILERMSPLLSKYGDLNDDNKFELLVNDVCRLVETNPVEWMDMELDRTDITDRCRNKSLMAVYGAIYDVYAELKGADSWLCKSLANINYIDEIETYFPNARYIYLYRDGRDVALSFQKAVVGEKHIYNIANDWKDAQEIALSLGKKIDSSRFFSISYEQLTNDAETSAQSLCKFLNVEYSSSMFEFHKTTEAKNAASSSKLWKNVTQPVINNNSNKFLDLMPERDLEIFESVAGQVLDELNFERFLVEKGKELKFSKEQINDYNSQNQQLKDKAMQSIDKEDMLRRLKQSALLKEIQSRKAA